ncbi:hypothetical protein HS125_04175 [bacterium]|nr:hypothetical protein [bacterium]
MQGQPGQILDVAINVNDASDVESYRIQLDWNGAVLEYVVNSATVTGTLAAGFTLTPNLATPSRLIAVGRAGTGMSLPPASGSLLHLQLKIRDSAAPGSNSPLALTVELNDGAIMAQTQNGQVSVGGTPVVAFFVLDDYGAVHTGGAANQVPLTGDPYFGWDIARGLELVFGSPTTNEAKTGVLLVDGFGALHTYSCRRPPQSFYFDPVPGEIAADVVVFQGPSPTGLGAADEIGVFVLDRTGKLWPAGIASWDVAAQGSITPALNGNTIRAVDLTLADNSGTRGWILDNMGKAYPFGGAVNPNFQLSTQDNWVDFEPVEGQFVRMDASGNLTWSGTPVDGWDLPMVDGGLAIDLEVEPGLGLIMIDRFGAIYTSGNAVKPAAGEGPPYFGFEAARSLEIGPPLGANVNNPTGQ